MTRSRATSPFLEALQRAQAATHDVVGGFAVEPWRFVLLSDEAAQGAAWLRARVLESREGPISARMAYDEWRDIPSWVVVTCVLTPDPAQQEHFSERTLTAVQRFTLSLWSDDVRTVWATPPLLSEGEFYRLVGVDPLRERILGLLWCYPPDEDAAAPVRS